MDPALTGVELANAEPEHFLGIVRIDFAALNFHHPAFRAEHRTLSTPNVARIRKVYELEGCSRTEEENFISALVERVDFERAASSLDRTVRAQLHRRPVPDAAPDAIPFLDLSSVDCLCGLHRVEAAREYLDENDRWWTVKLFSKGLPRPAITRLVERFANEQPFSDGEIFRKIRLYHRSDDAPAEGKWWARLTATKRKDLKQLLKNNGFARGFDALIDIPGLWTPIKLGTLHRFHALRCDEEIIFYLRHVSSVWNQILQNTRVPKSAIDTITVQRLESLAPSASAEDMRRITEWMHCKEIFSDVSELVTRDVLLRNIAAMPCMIPSLRTLFENLKYLEPCCTILRNLLDPKKKRTIRAGLASCYKHPARVCVDFDEHDTRFRSPSAVDGDRWLAYAQLWAYCLRHFPDMTAVAPRKERSKEKPAVKGLNPALWHGLGKLAVSLGFQSQAAIDLASKDPDRELASRFLQHARPDSQAEKGCIEDITRILDRTRQDRSERHQPETTSANPLALERRCGRPFEDDHVRDERHLFVPFLWADVRTSGSNITTLFVKRDLFSACLGLGPCKPHREMFDAGFEPDDVVMAGDENEPINGMVTQNNALEERLRALFEEKVRAISRAEELEARCRDLEGETARERRRFEDEMAREQAEGERLKAELATMRECSNTQVETLRAELELRNNDKLCVARQLSEKDGAMKQVAEELTRSRQEQRALEAEVVNAKTSLGEQKEALQAERERFDADRSAWNGSLSEKSLALSEAEQTLKELRTNEAELLRRLADLERDRLELEAKLVNAQCGGDALRAENERLKAMLSDARCRGEQLESQLLRSQQEAQLEIARVKNGKDQHRADAERQGQRPSGEGDPQSATGYLEVRMVAEDDGGLLWIKPETKPIDDVTLTTASDILAIGRAAEAQHHKQWEWVACDRDQYKSILKGDAGYFLQVWKKCGCVMGGFKDHVERIRLSKSGVRHVLTAEQASHFEAIAYPRIPKPLVPAKRRLGSARRKSLLTPVASRSGLERVDERWDRDRCSGKEDREADGPRSTDPGKRMRVDKAHGRTREEDAGSGKNREDGNNPRTSNADCEMGGVDDEDSPELIGYENANIGS